jgi:hypothetical protein
LFYIILKYQFIFLTSELRTVILESLTIGSILGGSALVTWLGKTRFQPEIERSIAATDSEEKAIIAKGRSKTH